MANDMSLESALVDGGVWAEIIDEVYHDGRWYSVHIGGETEITRDPYQGWMRPMEDPEIHTSWEVYCIQEEDENGQLVRNFEPNDPGFKEVWNNIGKEVARRVKNLF